MRSIRTRLFGTASALVLALSTTAFAGASHWCPMTEQASASGCCPKQHAAPSSAAEVGARGCCQWIEAEVRVAPSSAPEGPRLIAAPLVTVLPAQLPALATTQRVRFHDARVAHALGPPRFLVKCSFLI